MDANVLKTAIKARLSSEGFKLDDENCKIGTEVDIIVEEIISHIQSSAVVNVNTVVTGTLTPPTAVAGTGIGTSSIT